MGRSDAVCSRVPSTRRDRPPTARSIADELFGSFENLLTLSDKRGIPYDRCVAAAAFPHRTGRSDHSSPARGGCAAAWDGGPRWRGHSSSHTTGCVAHLPLAPLG